MFKKVEKTMVFAEGTNLQRLLDYFAGVGLIDNLRGYPNYEIIETATGKAIMKAPSIVGEAYPMVWSIIAKNMGLSTVDRPECKDMLFAFGK